jgi:DNA-binding transcriptional MerR regulator
MIQGGSDVKKRMTITEVAEIVGISPKTLARWEKLGKIRRPKRDWRGWRVYDEGDVSDIKKFHETLFEV